MIDDKLARLNSFYRIIDAHGDSVPFHLNDVQTDVAQSLHKRNLILKARQLGMSTFAVIYLLDECIFNANTSAGIVSYSLEHAQHIFKRIIGHALDTFLPELKPLLKIVNRSAREITFANGSFLRVDTSLRGGSYQIVLVSEFGKTCARSPQKAEEVITGTLQAVPSDGMVIIESTGEGNAGYYADMVNSAHIRGNDNLSPLEYHLFFYPWYLEKRYREREKVSYDTDLTDYFNKIEREANVTLDQEQRNWYALQGKILGEKIKQEFPSTISEAFLASSDAFYFAKALGKASDDGRYLHTSPYDCLLPVYVAMDIGLNDLTVMIFFQLAHGEVRIIDYYEDKDKDVPFYAKFLRQDKDYLYHTIFLPHDSTKRDPLDIDNSYERDFRRLFSGTDTRFHVLKRMDKQLSISNARLTIDRCVFNHPRVKKLIEMLGKYRKKWHEPTGRYLEDPWHDSASDYGDSFQYVAQAVKHLELTGDKKGALERHKIATEGRARRVV